MEENRTDKTILVMCPLCAAADCEHICKEQTQEISQRLISTEIDELGIPNKYEVLEKIGAGGMSVVYKVRHRLLNQVLAVKMLQGHLIRDSVQVRRFLQEAQTLYKLDHPNIVSVREVDLTNEGEPFIVMDFLDGVSLSELIQQSGTIPVNRALNIFMQACDALQHAHDHGIVHRDIKPSNIVISTDAHGLDVVKLLDFGIAKLTGDEDAVNKNQGLTQTGEIFGSPLYMSPEQCLGQSLDFRSDIYSLGCVMFEALSGAPPFQSGAAYSTIHMHTTELPPPLAIPNCNPALRQHLDQVVFKTLEKKPEKRYKNMAALRKELQETVDATTFRGNNAAYVSLARQRQKIANNLKAHPFLHMIAALGLCAIIPICSGINLLNKLNAEPKPISVSANWQWHTPQYDHSNFALDKLRKGGLLLDEIEARESDMHDYPIYAPPLIKLAMKSGKLEMATRFLERLQSYYKNNPLFQHTDPEVCDCAMQLGDCYYQLGEIERAREQYKMAYDGYVGTQKGNITDCIVGDGEVASMMRFLVCDRRLGKKNSVAFVDRVLRLLSDNGLMQEPEDVAMLHSLVADLSVEKAEATIGPERDELFAQAQSYYAKAQSEWLSIGKPTNAALCNVKEANVALRTKNYLECSRFMDSLWNETHLGGSLRTPDVRQTYASVLWRNGQPLKALELLL